MPDKTAEDFTDDGFFSSVGSASSIDTESSSSADSYDPSSSALEAVYENGESFQDEDEDDSYTGDTFFDHLPSLSTLSSSAGC